MLPGAFHLITIPTLVSSAFQRLEREFKASCVELSPQGIPTSFLSAFDGLVIRQIPVNFFGKVFSRLRQVAPIAMDKKVLIIDDEEDFGFLMNEYFSKKGYKVLLASSIAQGLEILENESPDFIFLDNNLPDGFGWSETEFILMNYPNTKLNLISAMEVPVTSASSFRILYKPYIKDELNKIFD